jgi:hypothetical protein
VSGRENIRLRFLARFAENQSIEGAVVAWDNLSEFEELVLKEMTDEGLVKPTSYNCKDEGRYQLTPSGRREYDEIRVASSTSSVVRKRLGALGVRGALILSILIGVYQFLSPSWLCPLLPDGLAAALERCEGPLRALTP